MLKLTWTTVQKNHHRISWLALRLKKPIENVGVISRCQVAGIVAEGKFKSMRKVRQSGDTVSPSKIHFLVDGQIKGNEEEDKNGEGEEK